MNNRLMSQLIAVRKYFFSHIMDYRKTMSAHSFDKSIIYRYFFLKVQT